MTLAAAPTLPPRARFDRRIYLLALGPFAFGTGAFAVSGLMDPMAADLGVSIGAAGQVSTALALTVALAAPLAAGPVLQRFGVRALPYLVALFGLACAACALAGDYATLIALRIVAGLAGCLISSFASTTAALMVPPERRPAALAIVFAGTSASFVIGAPAAIAIGATFGWRMLFAFGAVVALLAAFALRGVAPPRDAGPVQAMSLKGLWRPALAPLAATAIAFAATMASIAYLGPLVTRTTGITGAGIGLVQCLIGLGSMAGLFISARYLAARRHALTALFGAIAVTQASYIALAGAPDHGAAATLVMGLVTFIGAGALFGVVPLGQARLMQIGGQNAGVLMALNGSMIFLGQSVGTALGGLTIEIGDLAWTGLTGALIALAGMALGVRVASARA